MKRQRQEAILDIITNNIIETQEDLLSSLENRGYRSTQATISRDIKELSLTKTLVDGQYRYSVATKKQQPTKGLPLFQEGVISVAAAQNIVVVKTMPGFAMAVCAALDQMETIGNVGNLAGDDTCLLVMTNNDTAHDFTEKMRADLGL